MRIIKAELGKPIRYPRSHGDLWMSTWADDDCLYSMSDDTQGFDQKCSSNLALHRITGVMPPEIVGETINPMTEYGKWAETLEDRAMWKANGLTCIDGVLYMSVSRHLNPMSVFNIQETWDASVIKSADHGLSWSKAPELGHSMFPGHTFCTPIFVHYGKDGKGRAHESDQFVYAISSSDSWNNGSTMTLGRVRRDKIGRLDNRDWEFVQGYDPKRNPIWGERHDTAGHVFRAPGRTGMTGMHYIEPLNLYILPQWHFTCLEDDERRWKASCFEFYQAPAPWGPWELFHVQHFEPEGWYNPCIPAKFISPDGTKLWLFVAGLWTTCKTLDGYYGLFMIPVTLEVKKNNIQGDYELQERAEY